jgi:hypothetical protein
VDAPLLRVGEVPPPDPPLRQGEFTGSVQPVGDLRMRLRASRREAVAGMTRDRAEFPGILGTDDAVARWADAAGPERTGSPAEVYPTDRSAPDDGRTHVEVAWPVR